ncbi:MAG: 50S ribosomal protein L20 [Patescibacteria group bacterium]
MRVKGGTVTKRRHNKVRELTKGFWKKHRTTYKKAHETLLHAGQYAYAGRKKKKRDFRELWIIRINAAVRNAGMTYSSFINKLQNNNIEIDRKILSKIAVEHPDAFNKIVEKVK